MIYVKMPPFVKSTALPYYWRYLSNLQGTFRIEQIDMRPSKWRQKGSFELYFVFLHDHCMSFLRPQGKQLYNTIWFLSATGHNSSLRNVIFGFSDPYDKTEFIRFFCIWKVQERREIQLVHFKPVDFEKSYY